MPLLWHPKKESASSQYAFERKLWASNGDGKHWNIIITFDNSWWGGEGDTKKQIFNFLLILESLSAVWWGCWWSSLSQTNTHTPNISRNAGCHIIFHHIWCLTGITTSMCWVIWFDHCFLVLQMTFSYSAPPSHRVGWRSSILRWYIENICLLQIKG